MTVRYTPGQLCEVVSISPETYRHWKAALAPLYRTTRRGPCFTAGDLLAVALVRTMTSAFSIRVGAISSVAEQLFRICNNTSWPVLERGKLIVDLADQRLELRSEIEDVDFSTPTLVFPLSAPVGHLRDALLTEGRPNQQMLNFQPVPLPSRATAASIGGAHERH